MEKKTQFAIGFLAGRPNVCDIINCYYKDIVKQTILEQDGVEFTIFILLDLSYQSTDIKQFYNIDKDVHNYIKIKYITTDDIEKEKQYIQQHFGFKQDEIDLVLGNGYAKARNTIMYFALKNKIDYLLFWDDDEYPIANTRNKKNEIIWEKQNNILHHLNNIKNSNVTVGHRCGNMSPIPSISFNTNFTKKDFKNYINGISNEAIYWKSVKKILGYDKGIKFANKKILKNSKGKIINNLGKKNWVLGSGICINLQKIDEVPPFYNPPEARGEDAFFSTWLTNSKVLQVPTYHFHDGFLKYRNILEEKYPTEFVEIDMNDELVVKRFINASIGWIKYKPLLVYILQRKNYEKIINKTKLILQETTSKMSEKFNNYDFSILLKELEKYDNNVEKHYEEYINTFKIWEKLKNKLKEEI